MKTSINCKNLYLLLLLLWAFPISAQMPGTVQFDSNNFAQELIRENREMQQNMERENALANQQMQANTAALENSMFPQGTEILKMENYVRLNMDRCLQAQLPQGFCNLLMQPPWNQP